MDESKDLINKDDWAIPHGLIPQGHTILHEIASSSKTISYLAQDQSGKRVTMTYIEPQRVVSRFKFKEHQEGRSEAEANKLAHEWVERFQQQQRDVFKRVEGLQHAHVAEMYHIGVDEEKNSMVMTSEYAPGVDLFLATRRLKPLQMLPLFVQVLSGIDFIHSNSLLHLNIKPERIRVDMERIPPLLKLTDFGFAIPDSGYNGEYTGTSLYMAPEIILDWKNKINVRADLYSFAVTAYYCLTGHHPYPQRSNVTSKVRLREIVMKEGPPSPPSHFNNEIPSAFDTLVLDLLQKDPDERKYNEASKVIGFMERTWPIESKGIVTKKTTTVMDDS